VSKSQRVSLRTSSVFFASFQSIWVICPTFLRRHLVSSSSMSGVGTLARLAASLPGKRSRRHSDAAKHREEGDKQGAGERRRQG